MRHALPGHDVYTVGFMGWSKSKNGRLLRLAAESGFDVLITNDRGLEYEQNLTVLPLAVVVLISREGNRIDQLRGAAPRLIETLSGLHPKSFAKVVV